MIRSLEALRGDIHARKRSDKAPPISRAADAEELAQLQKEFEESGLDLQVPEDLLADIPGDYPEIVGKYGAPPDEAYAHKEEPTAFRPEEAPNRDDVELFANYTKSTRDERDTLSTTVRSRVSSVDRGTGVKIRSVSPVQYKIKPPSESVDTHRDKPPVLVSLSTPKPAKKQKMKKKARVEQFARGSDRSRPTPLSPVAPPDWKTEDIHAHAEETFWDTYHQGMESIQEEDEKQSEVSQQPSKLGWMSAIAASWAGAPGHKSVQLGPIQGPQTPAPSVQKTSQPLLAPTPSIGVRHGAFTSIPHTHYVGGRPTVYTPEISWQDRELAFRALHKAKRPLASKHPDATKQIGDFATVEQSGSRFHVEIKPGMPRKTINRIVTLLFIHGKKVPGAILTQLVGGVEKSWGKLSRLSKSALRQIISSASEGGTFVVQSEVGGGGFNGPLSSPFWTSTQLSGIMSR
jgi:hypothetical protein